MTVTARPIDAEAIKGRHKRGDKPLEPLDPALQERIAQGLETLQREERLVRCPVAGCSFPKGPCLRRAAGRVM